MDPQPADHTPSRSWRLPGLLFLPGTSDDHDRLGPRRSSSAEKCSSRRASHHAPRMEGWRQATPQTTPTARRSAPPPAPSGGGQCRAIGPAGGIGKYPSGLCMGICGLLGCRGNVERVVTPRGHPGYRSSNENRAMFRSAPERGRSPVRRDPTAPYSSSTGSRRSTFTFFPTHSAGR